MKYTYIWLRLLSVNQLFLQASLLEIAKAASCATDEEMFHHEISIAQAIEKNSSMQQSPDNDAQ
jgi:hypothetical protein